MKRECDRRAMRAERFDRPKRGVSGATLLTGSEE
jgi:hypothetical protein